MVKNHVILLAGLVILLFIINYSFLDSLLTNLLDDEETVIVDRVIDGDTIVAENTSVRLLGINSPERGQPYYKEAKEFLEDIVLNKTVVLKFGVERYDRYGRTLAYVFVGKRNVNLELVEKGFANFYFPSGKDVYYNDFKKAWEECDINLCERSEDKCVDCIELKEFDYKNEVVIFYNKCDFSCDMTNWGIKDEGRKNFLFPEFVLEKEKEVKIIVSNEEDVNNEDEIFWKRDDYVWTDSGDTLFLRDSKGKLILWRSY